MNALEIRNLSKSFDEFKLDNISLDLPQGYILGYIGQNGSGKTTTIKLIMEQLKKDKGYITVCGKNYADNEAAYKDMIGFIADECYYPDSFTIEDISDMLKAFYPSFSKSKFMSYTKNWGLSEKKKIKDFSKGMKIKLMFASVLSRETKLLLLDEPTSGLDPVIRADILELLHEYISDGTRSVFFSTHIMSDLEKIADYLCFIEKGKIIFNDTKDSILESFMLVKGGLSDLTPELEKKLIGVKKTDVGFTGLIAAKDRGFVARGALIEKPGIDDIVVFHINGVRG